MVTLVEILQKTEAFFKDRGIDTPRLDAELLLAEVLEMERMRLYLEFDRPMSQAELAALRPKVKRRGDREPMARVLGKREFWKHTLATPANVLIPRPDTETLVEAALELLPPATDKPMLVADVGTGTGAVAIAIATERPDVRLFATDVSTEACICAKANISDADLADRIAVLRGDLLDAIPEDRHIDLVVSNPPYIPTGEIPTLMPEVRDHDPHLALDGGVDGLHIVRRLITQTRHRGGPPLAIEIGAGQAEQVLKLLGDSGYPEVGSRNDLAGIPRVVWGR